MTAEFLWNSSEAKTSDDFEILQEFRSEFLMEIQLTQWMTAEFL